MQYKKIFFFSLSLLIASTFIFSCKKEKNSSPIMSVTPGSLYLYGEVGDLITFKISVSSENSLSKVVIMSTRENEMPALVKDTAISTKGTTFNYYFKIPTDLAGKSIVFDFKAEDVNGKTGGTAKRLYVNALPVSSVIVLSETSGHRMYSNLSTSPDAYDLETNSSKFSIVADTASRDIQDFSGADTTLSKNWKSPAGGKFVRFNSYDYANATDSSAIAAYSAGANQSVLYNVAVNDIIITKLGSVGSNKYVVLRITNIVDNAGKNNDYYEFNVKK
ncbi:MAG: hypothetical protein V4677_18200 [Bacteroidota bacterium]